MLTTEQELSYLATLDLDKNSSTLSIEKAYKLKLDKVVEQEETERQNIVTAYEKLKTNIEEKLNQMSHWEILDLKPGAPDEEIKKAYKKFSLLYHPDKNNDSEIAAIYFKAIRSAYEELKGEINPDVLTKYASSLESANIKDLNILTKKYNTQKYFQNEPNLFFIALLSEKYKEILALLFNNGLSIHTTSTLPTPYHVKEIEINIRKTSSGIVLGEDRRVYSKDYEVTSNALGFATLLDNIDLFLFLKQFDSSIRNIKLPISAKQEKYGTLLEFTAKNGQYDFIKALLECYEYKPSAKELNSSIEYARKFGASAIEHYLRAYRKKHYKYNPFKFGYNHQWQENVDNSLLDNIKALPSNFRQFLYDSFSLDGLYNVIFAALHITAFALLFVGPVGLASGYALMYPDAVELLVIASFISWFCACGGLMAIYDQQYDHYIDFMQTHVISKVNTAYDNIYEYSVKHATSIKDFFSFSKGNDNLTTSNYTYTEGQNIPPEYLENPSKYQLTVYDPNKVDPYVEANGTTCISITRLNGPHL